MVGPLLGADGDPRAPTTNIKKTSMAGPVASADGDPIAPTINR
jgi:hypothetical protein